MAGGELVQSIVRRHVNVRIAEVDVGVADVRCAHGEADELVVTRRNAALLNAAKARLQVFVSNHPLLAEIRTEDQVG